MLLIHKKTGHGAGRINGPGGKLDPGESALACARRELYEEVGLVAHDLTCRAEMRFVEQNGPQWLGFAFTGSEFTGDLVETDEARPYWCDIQVIPYDNMWPDDAIWLPKIIAAHQDQNSYVDVADYLFDDEVLLQHEPSSDASVWSTFIRP